MDLVPMDWTQHIAAAESSEGVQGALTDTIGKLGFRFFAYRGRFTVPGGHARELTMDGKPPEWSEWCCRHRIDSQLDPKWNRALQQVTPMLWREVAPGFSSLFGAARDDGMVTRVTYPVHAPHGDWSTLSLVNVYDSRTERQDIEASFATGQLLACFVHGVLSRLVRRESERTGTAEPENGNGSPTLSGRECECLQLTSSGLTAMETADRLHISGNTVIFHLKNARRKLGAANSRHALAKAIKLGIIQPS